jgi:hypothetical protein
MQQQQDESLVDRVRGTANLAIGIVKIFSLPAEMLLHFDVGETYIGLFGGMSMLLMFFFPIFFPHSNPAPLLLFLLAFVVRGACHRALGLWKYFKGIRPTQHRKRPGTPWLARLTDRIPVRVWFWLEGPIFAIVGTGAVFLNKPLGFFMVLSGWALLVITGLRAVMHHNQMMELHDRMLEQQFTSEGLRELQQGQ